MLMYFIVLVILPGSYQGEGGFSGAFAKGDYQFGFTESYEPLTMYKEY